MNHPLVKGYDVMGIRYDVWRDRFRLGARGNHAQLLTWCAEGRTRPVVSRVMPMSRAVDALTAIASRQVVGKVVLSPRSEP